MKRTVATCAVVLLCSAAPRADITILQTTTVEGGMASMAAASGQSVSPKVTTRIKGTKNRTDVEAGAVFVSTIVDIVSKQVIILRPDVKTATIVTGAPPAAPGAAAVTGPSVDATVTPTGKSQLIDGVKCDEYAFTTTLDMSSMAGPQLPPEALAMMQGMKMAMQGALWVAKDAPGAAEYVAYQKAVAGAPELAGVAAGASGMKIPGMEKVARAMSAVNGLTYLTEMTINIDGTGQVADMMRQMGPMKVTTKISSVTTSPIGDDVFKVPEGYTITKQ
jgi:hypothetical protein